MGEDVDPIGARLLLHVGDEAVEVGDRGVVVRDERVVLVGEDALLREAVRSEPHRVRLELLRGSGAAVDEDDGSRLLPPGLSGQGRLADNGEYARDNQHHVRGETPTLPLQPLRHSDTENTFGM